MITKRREVKVLGIEALDGQNHRVHTGYSAGLDHEDRGSCVISFAAQMVTVFRETFSSGRNREFGFSIDHETVDGGACNPLGRAQKAALHVIMFSVEPGSVSVSSDLINPVDLVFETGEFRYYSATYDNQLKVPMEVGYLTLGLSSAERFPR